MNPPPALLLLDLDGVTVFEHEPPWVEHREILLLHDELLRFLRALDAPVVVLTHRSRAEARRILHAAALAESGLLTGIVAAEDLVLAALRRGALPRLLGRGLRKSLCLSVVEARHGVARANMAFIDDRLDNLEDLLAHGVGLAMHAPSEVGPDGAITSFDFGEAAALFAAWRIERGTPRIVPLTPIHRGLADYGRTGICTTREGVSLFNAARLVARTIRRSLAPG